MVHPVVPLIDLHVPLAHMMVMLRSIAVFPKFIHNITKQNNGLAQVILSQSASYLQRTINNGNAACQSEKSKKSNRK